MRLLPLPTFLVIGAQKCGTRWLRRNLGLHRDVFTADQELEFFDHRFGEGAVSYRNQFEGWGGEPAVGEATPGYLFHRNDPLVMAGRMRSILGDDVAVVAILRDPVVRARSAYVHHLRGGLIDPEADPLSYFALLDPVTDPLGLVSGGWYGRSLQPYVDRFGDRVHVEFHEDALEDPVELLLRVFRHIGVEGDWVPEGLREVTNAGVDQAASRFAGHPALSVPDAELRPLLQHYFDDDIAWLESLIGRSAPW